MTEQDKREIAAILTDVLAANTPGCPNGIDPETAATLKSFAEAVKSGRKTAYKAFITLAIGAFCAAIFAGVKELLHK